MISLKGKKLLIIGTQPHMKNVIDTAKKMGVYVVMTDYIPNAPMKKYADKSYDISTTDYDALVEMAKNEGIDGVFTGWCDQNLYHAEHLCKLLNLPFYANKEQLDFSNDKLNFKETCRKYGVPIVKQYSVDSELKREDLELIEYPVMVKPTDSSGCKGCRLCTREEELRDCVETALGYSPSKRFIIEKYMRPENSKDVVVDYILENGVAHTSIVCDLDVFQHGSFTGIPASLVSPSKLTDEYMNTVDENVKKMFRELHIDNGRLFLQMFYDNEGFHLYEMGYRLSGAQEYIAIESETGISEIENIIYYALEGQMPNHDYSIVSPWFKHAYCNLHFICGEGTIGKIEGIEQVKKDKRVINVSQYLYEGSYVEDRGLLSQAAFRVYIKEENKEKLRQAVDEIRNIIKIYDENGQNMLFEVYDGKNI